MDDSVRQTMSASSGSDTSEESNWLDVEPDEEKVEIVSLFDAQTFTTLPAMLEHCRKQYGFDLIQNIHRLQLDFLGAIKLVNFIRLQLKSNIALPTEISLGDIEDDCYLKPVLENDAVIYSLDEVLESTNDASSTEPSGAVDESSSELHKHNKSLEAELNSIRESFANYRLAVEQTLDRRWGDDTIPIASASGKEKDSSGYYFESYAAHGTKHECSATPCANHQANRATQKYMRLCLRMLSALMLTGTSYTRINTYSKGR
jgi:protein arginine N-methyltransferase 3